MKLDDLVAHIAASTSVSKKDVDAVLKGAAAAVHETLAAGGEVTLPGIAKISSNLRPGRTGKNPRTGEALEIPAKHVPKLTVLKALKDAAAKEL